MSITDWQLPTETCISVLSINYQWNLVIPVPSLNEFSVVSLNKFQLKIISIWRLWAKSSVGNLVWFLFSPFNIFTSSFVLVERCLFCCDFGWEIGGMSGRSSAQKVSRKVGIGFIKDFTVLRELCLGKGQFLNIFNAWFLWWYHIEIYGMVK